MSSVFRIIILYKSALLVILIHNLKPIDRAICDSMWDIISFISIPFVTPGPVYYLCALGNGLIQKYATYATFTVISLNWHMSSNRKWSLFRDYYRLDSATTTTSMVKQTNSASVRSWNVLLPDIVTAKLELSYISDCLSGVSVAMLPRRLPNYIVIHMFQHPISRLRVQSIYLGKMTSCRVKSPKWHLDVITFSNWVSVKLYVAQTR